MVCFDIIKSPDVDSLGKFETFRARFFIGSSRSADLVIDDPEIAPLHLELFFTERGLHIKNSKEGGFYHVGGKKISGERIFGIGEEIRIGQTTLRIMGLDLPDYIKEKRTSADLYLKASEENPPLYQLLTTIEEEIEELKRREHV